MFKKTKIAAAMLAVVATGAQAAYLSPDQTGEVLIFPYYNVNNNFQTNILITNTRNETKIVKVRFRESGNSQDVLDFNVYLSPFDVWTGVIRNVNGNANIITDDTSCTHPMYNVATSVGTLNSTGWDMNTVYPDVTDADAREGYIEVIEVGVINPLLNTDVDSDGFDDSVTAGIRHASGVPADCGVVVAGWANGVSNGVAGAVTFGGTSVARNAAGGTFAANVADAQALNFDGIGGSGITEPTGGLYGNAIYLNTADGAAYVSDAVAINDVFDTAQHFLPDDQNYFLLPSLASGDVNTSDIFTGGSDVANPFGYVNTVWAPTVDATLNDGDANTPGSGMPFAVGANPYPVSHVLMATNVMNDYFVDPTYDAATDWVVTFPMRKHGVWDGVYTENCDGTTGDVGGTSVTFGTEGNNTCFTGRTNNVAITINPYDREEGQPQAGGYGVSPVIGTPGTTLTREVNVLTFVDTADSVLGSDNAQQINTGTNFTAGWLNITIAGTYNLLNAETGISDATVTFAQPTGVGVSGITDGTHNFAGVPVIGFSSIRGNNNVGSQYGETIPHKYVHDATP